MLNFAKILTDNQSISSEINEIFSRQENDDLSLEETKKLLNKDKFLKERILKNIRELDLSLILDNPFVSKMKNISGLENSWSLKAITLKAGHLFVSDETYIDEVFNEVTPLGYFNKNIDVPAVFEGKRIWMSVIPHEILTMQKPIDEAKGKVLAYGLGLGYFPTMVALKNEVKEVVVVEKEEEPINLFNKFIAPNFPEAKKIKIMKMDAFEHASKTKDGEYDMIFADIWHDAEDGLPLYARFLKHFSSFDKTAVSYWIEETILTYMKRVIEILLIEKSEGLSEISYESAETDEDELINKTYKVLKNELDKKEILSSNYVKGILTKI